MTATQECTIQEEKGAPLNAIRYAPDTGEARGVELIVPAMATPARHYSALANWFASEGFVVHVFDYLGYGALRDVDADILTWAKDAAIMLDSVATVEPGLDVHWVGHSLGGQLLPFTDHRKLTQATTLCSGTGYWLLSEGCNNVLAPLLWYAIAPIETRLCGYYPGRKRKLLGDLPAPVMRQWTRWCNQREYMLGTHPEFAEKFAAVAVPITKVSFTDDETATKHLESWCTGTEIAPKRYRPEEVGAPADTHMGVIRDRNSAIWSRVFSHITAP